MSTTHSQYRFQREVKIMAKAAAMRAGEDDGCAAPHRRESQRVAILSPVTENNVSVYFRQKYT